MWPLVHLGWESLRKEGLPSPDLMVCLFFLYQQLQRIGILMLQSRARDKMFTWGWLALFSYLPWSCCHGCGWHHLWEAWMGKNWKTLSSQGQVSPKPVWDGDSIVCCRVEMGTLGTAIPLTLIALIALSPGWWLSCFIVLTLTPGHNVKL